MGGGRRRGRRRGGRTGRARCRGRGRRRGTRAGGAVGRASAAPSKAGPGDGRGHRVPARGSAMAAPGGCQPAGPGSTRHELRRIRRGHDASAPMAGPRACGGLRPPRAAIVPSCVAARGDAHKYGVGIRVRHISCADSPSAVAALPACGTPGAPGRRGLATGRVAAAPQGFRSSRRRRGGRHVAVAVRRLPPRAAVARMSASPFDAEAVNRTPVTAPRCSGTQRPSRNNRVTGSASG